MSIDHRSRRYDGIRDLSLDEMIDDTIRTAIEAHGSLAARGQEVMGVPALGLDVAGRVITLGTVGKRLGLTPGHEPAGIVVKLDPPALSRLVQECQTTMGLAMTADADLTTGVLDDWIRWEPVLRALFDGRPVHEAGRVRLTDGDGGDLDLSRTFTLDDDMAEISQFLTQAGFVHIRNVFDSGEMDAVGASLDACLEAAEPDDGASWWATDAGGRDQPVRILWFNERSDALADLLADDRMSWLDDLTGDGHMSTGTAEGLVKPVGIVRGLSDLPWHKDCGQGHHAYMCNGMTVGISVTGADRDSGALGVIPGSHRANTLSTMRDPGLDLQPRMLETRTGDLTVHCSDTLHRAHPPVSASRKVVYTSYRLPPQPGDVAPASPNDRSRRDRADLSSVTDRIEAADHGQTRIGA